MAFIAEICLFCAVPLFALVDIETTHGTPSQGAITEVAVLLTDGQQITDRFTTLINPGQPIPRYISGLTGITDDMVANAPSFDDIAPTLRRMLEGRIFVAHNVSFDYQFIRTFLNRIGPPFQAPTLCTVRLARKAFPGYKSYSLGNICQSLGIPLSNRHRALGDAEATTILFHQSLEKLTEKEWSKLVHKGSNLDIWPPNLPPEVLRKLPHGPGVYYMKDERGQVLYVGKAIDAKKRLAQHFSEALRAPAKNAWWRRVYDVEFLQTGTEWMAFMVERLEIKRLWPEFNRAQKQPSFKFGLVTYTNASGQPMVAIDKLRKGLQPVHVFTGLLEAREFLHRLVAQHQLCPALCMMGARSAGDKNCHQCQGICPAVNDPVSYEQRIANALKQPAMAKESGVLTLAGRHGGEKAAIWFNQGYVTGFGFIPKHASDENEGQFKVRTYAAQPNHFATLALRNFIAEHPEWVKSSASVATPEQQAGQFQLL